MNGAKNDRRIKSLFIAEMICFALSSLSISAIYFTGGMPDSSAGVVTVIIALVFWLGIIAGALVSARAARVTYRCKRQLSARNAAEKQKLPGIISFHGSAANIALYALILAGAALSASDMVLHWIPRAIMYPIITVTVFAFEVHCVIDGGSFRAYKKVKEGLDNGR